MAFGAIGIDIGGTNIKGVTLNAGQVIVRRVVGTPRGDPGEVLAEVAGVVAEMERSVGRADVVGVTFPGHFDRNGVVLAAPNMSKSWAGFQFGEMASSALGREVATINDARAFGLAELRLGAAQEHKTSVGVTIGTGVGGVLIIGGNVFWGADGLAGEVGHQVVVRDGPTCGCGNQGCLEAVVRPETVSREFGFTNIREMLNLAARGDPAARKGVEFMGSWIGLGLANVVTLLRPSLVFVGGGVIAFGRALYGQIEESLVEHCPLVHPDEFRVRCAELGVWAGAIGAAIWAEEGRLPGARG